MQLAYLEAVGICLTDQDQSSSKGQVEGIESSLVVHDLLVAARADQSASQISQC